MVIISPCPKKRPKTGILERIPPTFVVLRIIPEKYTISMKRIIPKPACTNTAGRANNRIVFPIFSILLNRRKSI
jgi:hypothetical protein